ncbi:TlpA family protein disulfide reductase [Flavilitoribacter nigricans]|uniref:Thioredoxin n=1 Tax=Flavilitoribacter nigricans (strain ATCC 23147 / DSM 23189 / NBRC 102662 / NCIMB 1420 / SS-2) TaxID=1122177 RepID=A0A2D0MY02_FLAN2|nr:TlpA disulfide reductase family protein [Flavilitoribacter nigricans]PHN01097.1 thioredoxin [Flavilitoribacter nigricans DSM 23189 = NBRC 102662]
MKKEVKKELVQFGIIGLIALVLYATSLHTQAIGYLQRALLATGLIRPDTEQLAAAELESRPPLDLNIGLLDVNGQPVVMEAFRGKVIFVNLWATWCPPCLAEMPNIDQLYRDMDEEDVVFVMLSVDKDFSKAKTYVEGQDFALPIYQVLRNWPPELDATTIPSTFVIDRSGRIVLEHRGMAKYNTEDFRSFLRGLL